jgi:hypothetical protein
MPDLRDGPHGTMMMMTAHREPQPTKKNFFCILFHLFLETRKKEKSQ